MQEPNHHLPHVAGSPGTTPLRRGRWNSTENCDPVEVGQLHVRCPGLPAPGRGQAAFGPPSEVTGSSSLLDTTAKQNRAAPSGQHHACPCRSRQPQCPLLQMADNRAHQKGQEDCHHRKQSLDRQTTSTLGKYSQTEKQREGKTGPPKTVARSGRQPWSSRTGGHALGAEEHSLRPVK